MEPDEPEHEAEPEIDLEPETEQPIARFLEFLRSWGPVVITAVVIALVVRSFLMQPYTIPSLSMAPTLDEGDRVIVNRLSYRFGEIERGQVIVFDTPPNQRSQADVFIKRVIALPGETVQFADGNVFVDGLLLVEPYLSPDLRTGTRNLIPGCLDDQATTNQCIVPEGFVFVLGDNRPGSEDSRVFGPVDIDTIVGRAFIRVWPIGDINQL